MAKLLEFDNSSVLYDATEIASLKVPNSAGTNVSLTIDDNSDLAQNDYIFIGIPFQPKSEIAKINAAVSAGTTIQVDSLTFPHESGTPITKINYNQVEISRAATLAGSKSVLTTLDLDVDNLFTTYRDTTYSTGYAFYRLKNSTTSAYSGYSAGFDYSTADDDTIEKVKYIINQFYKKDIDETTLDMLIDAQVQEIYSLRFWKFREASASFTSVADTATYSFATAGVTDFSALVYATYDGDPVWPTDMKKYQMQKLNTASGQPASVFQWENEFRFTPAPSSALTIELFYYKNHTSFSSNTSTTAMELPSAIAYGVLRDLWGPVSEEKTTFYGSRYSEKIALMKRNDEKELGIFPELTRTMSDVVINDQVKYPNTITPAA